ncbi:hypothetical protein ACJ7K1_27750 [Paenibacillus elgii]
MDHKKELYKILEETYLISQKVLKAQKSELFDNPDYSSLYQAYSIANNKLKNALDLFQILLNEEN